MAENTQLFQVINIDGNTLDYKAYTTSGALYDAFELHKSNKRGSPNKFKEGMPKTKERTHRNTVPVY
jgi:hypothetical protein